MLHNYGYSHEGKTTIFVSLLNYFRNPHSRTKALFQTRITLTKAPSRSCVNYKIVIAARARHCDTVYYRLVIDGAGHYRVSGTNVDVHYRVAVTNGAVHYRVAVTESPY